MRRPVMLTDMLAARAALRIGCIGYRNAPLLLPTAKARTLCVYITLQKKEVPKILLILLISAMFKKIIFYVLVAMKWSVFFGGEGQSIVTSYLRGSDFL